MSERCNTETDQTELKVEEGATNQGIRWHFEARKGKEMDSFLDVPLEGHRSAGTLISAP